MKCTLKLVAVDGSVKAEQSVTGVDGPPLDAFHTACRDAGITLLREAGPLFKGHVTYEYTDTTNSQTIKSPVAL